MFGLCRKSASDESWLRFDCFTGCPLPKCMTCRSGVLGRGKFFKVRQIDFPIEVGEYTDKLSMMTTVYWR